MTEKEFYDLLYEEFFIMRSYSDIGPIIDEFDLLWMAAMRLAMEVDRDGVSEYCDKEKPLLDKYDLQRRQFAVYKRIATRKKNTGSIDLKSIRDQFQAKMRKERKR